MSKVASESLRWSFGSAFRLHVEMARALQDLIPWTRQLQLAIAIARSCSGTIRKVPLGESRVNILKRNQRQERLNARQLEQ